MKHAALYIITCISICMNACQQKNKWMLEGYETSASGQKLSPVRESAPSADAVTVTLDPGDKFQQITGFGGSFTEAAAHVLNRLSSRNRELVLQAYFGEDGARYSLTRTHINSCDFSLGNYSYANTPGDMKLENFSVAEDKGDLIPMIQDALEISKDGFKIIASPWTAPPWMKDNRDWRGGKLLPEYYPVWALYFSKYIQAYRAEGINIWGITVENEPLGNNNNWESMHFTPEEMNDFVSNYLGPGLVENGLEHVRILGYDQNRGEELKKWADHMWKDEKASKYFSGTAVHWYASTYDYFPESLRYTHLLAPGKHLINTEACVDAEVPKWREDAWYWNPEATDWGWDWAPEKEKYLHPKYAPVFRYARDIIGCLNNYVDGWIDWNMVLDRQGGPNWFKNWCVAPVIADPEKDEVYFTPLYYTLSHFSRFIRPGAIRIGFSCTDPDLMLTAAENPDQSVVLVLFNSAATAKDIRIRLNDQVYNTRLADKAIQTLVLKHKN